MINKMQVIITFFIEFFAKGNMLLCDANQTILSPLQPQSWSDRTLRGGIPYEHPVRDTHIFSLTLEKLKQLPFQDTISKTLAIELGIGGLYAEEICKINDLDFTKLPADTPKGIGEFIKGLS